MGSSLSPKEFNYHTRTHTHTHTLCRKCANPPKNRSWCLQTGHDDDDGGWCIGIANNNVVMCSICSRTFRVVDSWQMHDVNLPCVLCLSICRLDLGWFVFSVLCYLSRVRFLTHTAHVWQCYALKTFTYAQEHTHWMLFSPHSTKSYMNNLENYCYAWSSSWDVGITSNSGIGKKDEIYSKCVCAITILLLCLSDLPIVFVGCGRRICVLGIVLGNRVI